MDQKGDKRKQEILKIPARPARRQAPRAESVTSWLYEQAAIQRDVDLLARGLTTKENAQEVHRFESLLSRLSGRAANGWRC
jgi:hypothetical protein